VSLIYDETPTLQCANRREAALQRLMKTEKVFKNGCPFVDNALKPGGLTLL
jgi:hypothetical protein